MNLENNRMDEVPTITSKDYWFKVVDFLQQNWAVIEKVESGFRVYFFDDSAGIFDQLDFQIFTDAAQALIRNGFEQYDQAVDAQQFIGKPLDPFRRVKHWNGAIYSSGRFWR